MRQRVLFELFTRIKIRQMKNIVLIRLQKKIQVGKMTNILRLRGKHFFNKHDPDELAIKKFFHPSTSTTAWPRYCRGTYQPVDSVILSMMNEALSGRNERVSNIQVSIADPLAGAQQVGKNTLLGKLNRRHVQLIECGKD